MDSYLLRAVTFVGHTISPPISLLTNASRSKIVVPSDDAHYITVTPEVTKPVFLDFEKTQLVSFRDIIVLAFRHIINS